jgi:hypothetical protein
LILACPSRYNPAGSYFGIYSQLRIKPQNHPKGRTLETDPKTTRAQKQAADFKLTLPLSSFQRTDAERTAALAASASRLFPRGGEV